MIMSILIMVRRVVRAVGWECWWWLSGGGRLLRRHPVRSVAWLLAVLVGVVADARLLLIMVVVPVALVGLWARLLPGSYRRLAADRLYRAWLRRWVRRSWPSLMESCGLARRAPATSRRPGPTSAAERLVVPRLASCRWRQGRLVMVPGLVSGQTVADVEDAAERLRTSVGAVRLRVIPDNARTSCQIVAGFEDPLAQMFTASLPDPAVPAGSAGLSVVLGRTEDGEPWRVDLGVSCLTAGCSGAGKGSVMWSLVLGLAPAVRAGLVEVHGIDLKGGMELGLGRPLFTRYADDPQRAVILLEEAVRDCENRARRMAGTSRQHVASVGEPWVVVIIDELASLVAYLPDRDLVRRAEVALARLCSIGRAPGFVVFGFLQDPRKETLKARHLFGQTIALRLREREEVAMALGDGAISAGAACHHIPRDLPGVGFVIDDTGRLTRVRAGFVPDRMIIETAHRFAAPHPRPIEVPDEPEQQSKSRSRSRSAA
ncbi:hypothetical protein FOE78_03390 [Microlunatus elymi]|uniref:FtsK domain-containing protein n=1 Tax=Microlunatus elymi TaxID=2596828 RepID=A0A516PV94_9ACTN|nr:FtsK/SpoIIIE domain-containing protein [Microlunatus elymi]QDP95083.1 hypothetical protein FOE78_03390 [Microlunatus elymi]